MARTGALSRAVRIEPTGTRAGAAGAVAEAMADESIEDVVLTFPDGRTVPLPAALADLLARTAGELASGHAVTVLPADAMLTPAEAADVLGLSRPFVVRLLDDGTIPSERLPRSRHRRIRLADVLVFAALREQRRDGRRRVADAVADADLPY